VCHIASHCNTMQHAATHYNTLPCIATLRSILKMHPMMKRAHMISPCTATHRNTLQHSATHCNAPQHTSTRCKTEFSCKMASYDYKDTVHKAVHCNRLNRLHQTATDCNRLLQTARLTKQHTTLTLFIHTPQHTATHCNTLQHTATRFSCTYEHIQLSTHPPTHQHARTHTHTHTLHTYMFVIRVKGAFYDFLNCTHN